MKLVDWIFLAGLFLVFLLPANDPDLGWHLRCGEMIWQREGWCNINQFSVLLEDYDWPNHHWLYQVVVWGSFDKLRMGFWGLTILGAVVMGLAFWFWYLAVSNLRLEKIGLIGLIGLISWGVFSFGIRSQLLGLLYFNLLLWIFSRLEEKPRLVWLIPLVMLVWANSHGSVVLGLGLVGWWGLREGLKGKKGKKGWICLGLAAGITLVNPFGWRIYQEAWRHFGGVNLSGLIAEWVPPNRNIWWLVLVSAVGLFGWLLVGRGRALEGFLVLVFALLALKARRQVPHYLVLAGWVGLRRGIRGVEGVKGEVREALTLLAALSFLFYGLFIRLPLTAKANSSGEFWCQQLPVGCPQKAVEFLKGQPVNRRGNIFNRYEWGGFLIWQLPEYKIFVDGRMPAWLAEAPPTGGAKAAGYTSPYTIYLETLQTQPGWQETLDEYEIDWILISPGTFMDLKLAPEPESFGWEEVYRDKTAVVYGRAN